MNRSVPLLLAAVLMASLLGCGKSSTQPKIDPGAAQAEVNAGNAALANGDYATANMHYKKAIALDPGNAQAHFGAGVTEVFLVQDDPDLQALIDQYFGGGSTPHPARRAPGARPEPLARRVEALRSQVGGRFTPLTTGRATVRLFALTGDPAISEIQALIRTRVMPRLQYAEDRLNAVEAAAGFVLVLTPEMTGAPDPIEIDKTEIYLLDSVINDLQGWLGLIVAYNFDVPNNDYENVDLEALLADGSDWATLHPSGGAQLAAAKADFMNIAARFNAAVAYLGNEADDQSDDLIPKEWLGTEGYAEAQQGIDDVDAALSGPVPVATTDAGGQPFTLQVNIGRIFVPAIPDLKDKLPYYTIVDNELVPDNPLVMRDPIINGIFPDMTDERWRQLTGLTGTPGPARGLRASR